MNAVTLAVVESPIILVMADLRPRIHENPLSRFNNFKWLATFSVEVRNSFDLFALKTV